MTQTILDERLAIGTVYRHMKDSPNWKITKHVDGECWAKNPDGYEASHPHGRLVYVVSSPSEGWKPYPKEKPEETQNHFIVGENKSEYSVATWRDTRWCVYNTFETHPEKIVAFMNMPELPDYVPPTVKKWKFQIRPINLKTELTAITNEYFTVEQMKEFYSESAWSFVKLTDTEIEEAA